jgi:tetratricopeptide (TPR) repeat protein
MMSTNKGDDIRSHKIKTGCWLLLICLAGLCSSCATWEKSRIDEAERSEFHGDHHVFWPYANAGFAAAADADWAATQHWYLRAYRNTGMDLLPRQDSPSETAMFGLSADLADKDKIVAYASELDGLTPLPGTGEHAGDMLDTAMNYQRSLAAYDWARATGRLGAYAEAERAFWYSLQLEKTRNVPEPEKLTASRYFELARLYHAWGKPKEAIQCYHAALAITDQRAIKSDPVGFATVLDEFASYLNEAGQTNEAAGFREQSTKLRSDNPGKAARFKLDPYPLSKS